MANEQTSVPLYASSEILTAANMNISAGTGVPVFATTVTRDAAFGGANEKVLAEGQLCYLSSTNVVQYYDGAAWATVGPAVAATSGLTLISTTTIGSAVASVTVSSVFNSTYDNYRVIVNNTTSTAANGFGLTLNNSAGSTYQSVLNYTSIGAGSGVESEVNATKIKAGITTISSKFGLSGDFLSPNIAAATQYIGLGISLSYGTSSMGYDTGTTAHTGFTFTPVAGTLTGGTIKVYGYQNS